MANRPANAGAHSAGPQGPAAAPPPVHHQDYPRRSQPGRRRQPAEPKALAWVPYLIVLAGAIAGLVYAAWHGTGYGGRGAAVVGGALLVAAAARLVLPPRYAGLLAARSKAQDVAAFAVLGVAVLAVAVSLP
jgi:hypothetical protein